MPDTTIRRTTGPNQFTVARFYEVELRALVLIFVLFGAKIPEFYYGSLKWQHNAAK